MADLVIVTGFTAARMQAIEDSAVISGLVDGSGELILSTHAGDTIDAGHVVGPIGPTGPTGPPGAAGLSSTQVQTLIEGLVTDLGSKTGALDLTTITTANAVNGTIKVKLTGNATLDAAKLPAAVAGLKFKMAVTQDASGSRTLTLTGIKTPGGGVYLSKAANAVDLIDFFYDGVNWFANQWRSPGSLDTGWVAITPLATFAASTTDPPALRLKNGEVKGRGAFLNTGMTAGNNFTVANLPASIPAPEATVGNGVFCSGSSSGAASGAAIFISTASRTITLRLGTTLGAYYMLNDINYWID